MKNLLLITFTAILFMACSDLGSQSNASFITLNNKMEASIEQIEANNTAVTQNLKMAVQLMKVDNRSPKAISQAQSHLQSLIKVNELTREIRNFLIDKNHQLLIESIGTEAELNSILDGQGLPVEWIYEDERGYKYLNELSWFTKKDDHMTPTRLFVGPDHNNIAENGKELVERLINYRNELCIAIANYSEGEGDRTINFNFDPTGIPKLTFLTDDFDREEFEARVEAYIADQRVRKYDQEVLKNIIIRLTMPEKVMMGGEAYPWIVAQFEHAPIVSSTAIFTSLRMDIIGAETLASKLISNRVRY